MKEVKIKTLNELSESGTYHFGQEATMYPDAAESIERERQTVEQGLADLMNRGWHLAVTGGQNLEDSYVILVRDI